MLRTPEKSWDFYFTSQPWGDILAWSENFWNACVLRIANELSMKHMFQAPLPHR
jgi:hypothetical protein